MGDRRHYLTEFGLVAKCPDYQWRESAGDKIACKLRKCESDRDYATKDAECKSCPQYKERAKNGVSCTRKKCKVDEHLTSETKCKKCTEGLL